MGSTTDTYTECFTNGCPSTLPYFDSTSTKSTCVDADGCAEAGMLTRVDPNGKTCISSERCVDNAFLAFNGECLDFCPGYQLISEDWHTCVSSCKNMRFGEITYRSKTVLKCMTEAECTYRILESRDAD